MVMFQEVVIEILTRVKMYAVLGISVPNIREH